jgi:hypothetical protein
VVGEPIVVKTEGPLVGDAWPRVQGGVNGGPTCHGPPPPAPEEVQGRGARSNDGDGQRQ